MAQVNTIGELLAEENIAETQKKFVAELVQDGVSNSEGRTLALSEVQEMIVGSFIAITRETIKGINAEMEGEDSDIMSIEPITDETPLTQESLGDIRWAIMNSGHSSEDYLNRVEGYLTATDIKRQILGVIEPIMRDIG